jgi:iron(III) transport system substrate-binding protein
MVVLSSEDRVSEEKKEKKVFFSVDIMDVFVTVGILIVVAVMLTLAYSNVQKKKSVVIYTSQDQTYAEAILQEFTKQTGIKVRAVYDSEAVKTVGLVNRLSAEKNHPQCDVFWNNEELRTHQLTNETILRHTNSWMEIGYRARQLVINTNLISSTQIPKSLHELTNSVWRGKVALAYPLFGTTATHFLVLRQRWGESAWENFCRALHKNEALLVDGNSVVVKLVGKGEALIGLTDSDDILAGQREGLPIATIDIGSDGLFIANTVCVIRGAPHPEQAQKLLAFLTRRETAEKLVRAGALFGAEKPQTNSPAEPDWNGILQQMEPAIDQLREIFLR